MFNASYSLILFYEVLTIYCVDKAIDADARELSQIPIYSLRSRGKKSKISAITREESSR